MGSLIPRDQIANIRWTIEKQENSRKTSTSALLITLKSLTMWITTNCGKFLEIGIPNHLTCFLQNLYVGQEATVRTRHGTTDLFKIGKGVHQGCILLPCFSSVQSLSRVQLYDSMECSTPGFPVHHQLSELAQTISSSVIPFSSHLKSFPASGSFQMSQFFESGDQSFGISASASVLPKNIQTDILENGLVGSSCSPRGSQESSPTPQFKSINSLVLRFLYSPTHIHT